MVNQEAPDSRDIVNDTNHITFNQPIKRKPDEYLPIANVIKIMRRVLPPQVNILDESKEIIQECASEFIAFLTRLANENCHRECRNIIKPEDILSTMESTGFDNYIEPLTVFLNKHRSNSGSSSSYVQSLHVPKIPEAMNLIPQPLYQPAIFRPEPHVIQPAMSFGHAAPSTSALYQTNADELSQILDYFTSDQSTQGEGSCGSSLFEPYNKPMN